VTNRLAAALVATIAVATIAGCRSGPTSPSIHDAYVIAPAGSTATMYFTIDNPTPDAVSLVSVSTPMTGDVEMHTISSDGGLVSMTQVTAIAVEPHATVSLDPAGSHVMLVDIGQLTEGSKIPTTFTFSDGRTVDESVVVKSSGYVAAG